jgi:enoyl-CoA hydratase/carnithine racemase
MPEQGSNEAVPRVTIAVHGSVADVRLNRPDKRNALDAPMFQALAEAGEALKSRPEVRAVVLSGEGSSFCAGLDLSVFGSIGDGAQPGNPTSMTPSGMTQLAQQVAWVWQELPVPVIAAIQGHALGGGIQIALGTDIRIVHPDTQLSVREIYWGLLPDMTGTLMLTQIVRPDVAKELTFTGRIISGREALELGLATRLSEAPRDDAMALAAEIAGRNPDAVRESKGLFNRLLHAPAAEQFAAERSAVRRVLAGANQMEAVNANLEKRPPVFTDPT